jgi:predicted  nucleic acid-binding Zn-ribbon protein
VDEIQKLLPVLAFLGQAGLVFFFLGKMKGAQDGSAALFKAYEKHQDAMLAEYKASTAAAIGELKAAVHGLDNGNERAAHDRATLREEIAAFRATTEAEGRFTREAVEGIKRDVHQLQRQMSNVAAGTRPKVTELGGPKV